MAVTGAVLAGSVQAQELPPPPAPDPVAESAPAEPPARDGPDGPSPGAATVSLGRAVRIALEQNFTLLGAADGVVSARLRHAASRANFHPKLTPRYERSQNDESLFGLQGSQRLPWTGGSLVASADLRSSAPPDVPLARGSELRLELSQPLLRGFGPTAAFYELTNSRRRRESQERSYELSRQRVAVDVASAFYQVVQQRGLLAVAGQSLRRTESLERASGARLEVGLVSKLDVFRAQLQAAQAQESMVRARAALESALERFRFLLGLSASRKLSSVPAQFHR